MRIRLTHAHRSFDGALEVAERLHLGPDDGNDRKIDRQNLC